MSCFTLLLLANLVDTFFRVRKERKSGAAKTNVIPLPAVEAWLALMDKGDYAQSWEAGSRSFRWAVTKGDWMEALEKVRRPLGKIISRKVASIKYSAQGFRFDAKFDSSFDGLKSTAETLVFTRTWGGEWKPAGYLIGHLARQSQSLRRLKKFFFVALPVAVLFTLIVRAYFLQPFYVAGGGVEPELPVGSRILVWKFHPHYAPGDIIAHWHDYQVWASRVVSAEDSGVTINRNGQPDETIPNATLLGKVVSVYWRGTPQLEFFKSDYIGQTSFPKGDSIEITKVVRTKDRLMTKGRYNLVSADSATLALYLTTTNDIGGLTDSRQELQISKGRGEFELVHTCLVPGLPHVSMYAADGKPFAAIYFGTEAEALAESRASWITNKTSAATETWSPTNAPGEKIDVSKILSDAKDLMDQGRYEEALQRQLWYFNHALEYDQGQTGVRLSFALSQWVELGRHYPKAKQALIEIRDQDTRALAEGKGYANLFADVSNINRELQDDDATYALFKTIREKDPQLARQCFFWVESLLVAKGEYQWCYDYMGDPQLRLETIHSQYEMQLASQKQMAESQQHTKQMIAETNRKNGRTNAPAFSPPDTSAFLKKSAEDRFVSQTRQLIEILMATGHKPVAGTIRDKAITVLDDARLQSAVSDAKTKIAEHGQKAAIQTWLSLMDTGAYSQSWETAAESFHGAVTKEEWISLSKKVRQPLGEMVSRKEISARSLSTLPGMPDGSYFVEQFATVFTGLASAVETVTFSLEKGGQWKAVSYLILPHDSKSLEASEADQPAVSAMQSWLALVDAGDYAQSWEAAADGFHHAIAKEEWISKLKKVRTPLGGLVSRKLESTQQLKTISGMPDGDYIIAKFDTGFAQLSPLTETVVFSREKNGTWKAAGYTIRDLPKWTAASDEDKPAISAAQKWLAGIDAGNYSQSWENASKDFRSAITSEKWVSSLESVRKPLGGLISRKLQSERRLTKMPGAPDGQYVIMQFDTSFTDMKSVTETVTFAQEKDGMWRASGYYIK